MPLAIHSTRRGLSLSRASSTGVWHSASRAVRSAPCSASRASVLGPIETPLAPVTKGRKSCGPVLRSAAKWAAVRPRSVIFRREEISAPHKTPPGPPLRRGENHAGRFYDGGIVWAVGHAQTPGAPRRRAERALDQRDCAP
jgi:hypothetical protein